MRNTAFDDRDEVSPEVISRALPRAMLDGARKIEAHIEAAFSDVGAVDRDLCVVINFATWVHELDKLGRLKMRAADVAFVYQAGRIAAQEIEPHLLGRLQSAIEALQLV